MFLLKFIFTILCMIIKSLIITFVTLFVLISIYCFLVDNKYLNNYADNIKVNKEQTQVCYSK